MIKKIMKKILPNSFIKVAKNLITITKLIKFKKMSNSQIFKEIYTKKLWSPENEKNNHEFYSGTGSHFEEFSETYIKRVKEFLSTFSNKPNVVDLGCGDFSIGSKLRNYCNSYIAIDIFDELIERNKIHYKSHNVDFRVLDITKDNLPSGDICFVRQVLQHLSNKNIEKFLTQIRGKYSYLILTEHLPSFEKFKSNVDIITGPEIRLYKKSGVVLTEEPFNLIPTNEKIICNISSNQIPGFEGVLNTKIYQFKKEC